MGCVFCDKIREGSVFLHPSLPVVCFEPLNPVIDGHMLFVHREHTHDARENPEVTGMVFQVASEYGSILNEDFNLITSAGPNATQTVFHTHIHLVPRREGDGLHLPWTGQV